MLDDVPACEGVNPGRQGRGNVVSLQFLGEPLPGLLDRFVDL